jgi:hypothetical protein
MLWVSTSEVEKGKEEEERYEDGSEDNFQSVHYCWLASHIEKDRKKERQSFHRIIFAHFPNIQFLHIYLVPYTTSML